MPSNWRSLGQGRQLLRFPGAPLAGPLCQSGKRPRIAGRAYLGEAPEPVVYGVQGALREYYGATEGPPIASTLDHIVAAVAG